MRKNYNILIADRNSHVRELLRRELTLEGYQVQLAKTGQEIIQYTLGQEPLDLLIVDPDLPDTDNLLLVKTLREHFPALTVVVHSFLSEKGIQQDILNTVTFVEKRGSSIDRIKKTVAKVLDRT
ncbi:MAG: response regulator [Thermodesulfobacteriota bacterium]|nr:response regulator [Thermodesulfobacteriota bacterium]